MISTSAETKALVEVNKGPITNVGFFPIDPPNEISENFLKQWKEKFAQMTDRQRKMMKEKMGVLNSPLDKKGMHKYDIHCNNCDELIAYVWGNNANLDKWCDLHYVQWTDGDYWYGCLTPNISPIDGKIGFECCCGEDTRDFRNNVRIGDIMKKDTSLGREFGKKNSKFRATKVK